MPKYSTDSETTSKHWDQDLRHVLYSSSSKPFQGVRHRHETVEQRIVIEYHHGVGMDVRWEARSTDTEKIPDEWALVEEISVRDGRARHDRHARARWLQ
ncbi:hypothetical protein D3D02_16915 [Halobellus sp. Atlit-38R]|uniref:hypothetical protein n=1 Tax=Halobellus sp. Atlit-38R TaxID=2282131 RepID=UPI000EF19B63|nr:hypothetical protein [Halobellus sp. Atlit-38R]RLM83683.1 hypothetical protein D3D02_16915 [Halobellus sp. Atlit-38R]